MQVDLVDDLKVTREQVLDQWDRPLLKSFCHDSVVGVAKGIDNNAPSSVPVETLLIYQDALQLRNGKRRVSVVKLDGNLVGELLPGLLRLLETTDDIVERGSTPEVLLLETKLFAAVKADVVSVDYQACQIK